MKVRLWLLMSLVVLTYASLRAPAAEPAPGSSKSPVPFASRDVVSPAGGAYRIMVWSPKGPAPASGFPVIYVLDGNAWAPLVADIIKVNVYSGPSAGGIVPAIVVGIGYPTDEPFDLTRRVWDLTTPTQMNRDVLPDRNGGYAKFFDFIEGTVKPDIERRYSVDRTRQTLLGHSLGGEFVLRTLLSHPASYRNYAALSPSIWWDGAALLRDAKAFAPDAALVAKARVYLAVGELEQHMTPAYHEAALKEYRDYAIAHPEVLQGKSVDALVEALDNHNRNIRMVDNARDMQLTLAAKGFTVRFDAFPGEDHFSAVPSELGRALPFVLKP